MRSAFIAGRPDTLGLLFSGKLDIWSIAALGELRSQGLVKPAKYLPPWALDPGWVLSHLTLNAFIANVDLTVDGRAPSATSSPSAHASTSHPSAVDV